MDEIQTRFQRVMAGATRDFKERMLKSVEPATMNDVKTLALRILADLPKELPPGTVSAGLMLAATAHAEAASHARKLIEAELERGA